MMPTPTDLRRILVVGTSGSGKSTLAATVAHELGSRHIELDALHHGPHWSVRPTFQDDVEHAISDERWTCCGNYAQVQPQILARATLVVWLDYPRAVSTWRVVSRTVRRRVTRQELWNGNRESLRNAFFAPDGVVRWSWTSSPHNRERYGRLFAEPRPFVTLRLTHPRDTDRWLRTLQGANRPG